MKYLGIKSAPLGNQSSQYQPSIQIIKPGARSLDTNSLGR